MENFYEVSLKAVESQMADAHELTTNSCKVQMLAEDLEVGTESHSPLDMMWKFCRSRLPVPVSCWYHALVQNVQKYVLHFSAELDRYMMLYSMVLYSKNDRPCAVFAGLYL